ncbi:hypothetical protein ACQKWADRAFT_301844 [Trichoderma austrokoningii]
MWLCGSTGKRDTICHLFFFLLCLSHHPRAGIWETVTGLWEHTLEHALLCIFFFLFVICLSFFSYSLYLTPLLYLLYFISFRLELQRLCSQSYSLSSAFFLRLTKYSALSAIYGGLWLFSNQEKIYLHDALGGATGETDLHISYGFEQHPR